MNIWVFKNNQNLKKNYFINKLKVFQTNENFVWVKHYDKDSATGD